MFFMSEPQQPVRARTTLRWFLLFLSISASYLYAFPRPNISYASIVLLHAAAGVIVSVLLILRLYGLLKCGTTFSRAGWLFISAGALAGLVLFKTGTPRAEWSWLYAHMLFSTARMVIELASRIACALRDLSDRDCCAGSRRRLCAKYALAATCSH